MTINNNNNNNNKSPRKNKDDSFQLTSKTVQYFNGEENNLIYDLILLFNKNKRTYANYEDPNAITESQKRKSYMELQEKNYLKNTKSLAISQKLTHIFNNTKETSEIKIPTSRKEVLPFTYRFFQGIRQEVNGIKKSIKSNHENYIDAKKNKIVQFENKIKANDKSLKNKTRKLKKELKDKLITMIEFDDKIIQNKASHKKQSIFLHQSLTRFKNDLLKLENNQEKICFGGKKLLKKRHKCKTQKEINDFHNEWFYKRNSQMVFVGSHEETQGNSLCSLYYNQNKDTFSLNITVPNIFVDKYGKNIIIEDFDVPKYQRDEIKRQVLAHQYNIKGAEAISFRFIKHPKNSSYRVNISINIKKAKIITNNYSGLIGVDINEDHLAVTEIDYQGNYLESMSLPLDLKDKTTGQRENLICRQIIKLKDYAISKNKHLVVEKLDFKKKKSELKKGDHYKKYNKMITQFSYAKILNAIDMISNKYGVGVIKVSPAYTSLIGKVKYSTLLGLSTHMAAAYVIARIGNGNKEKLGKKIHTKNLGAVLELHVPEGIRRIKSIGNWCKVNSLVKKAIQSGAGRYVPHNRLVENSRVFR